MSIAVRGKRPSRLPSLHGTITPWEGNAIHFGPDEGNVLGVPSFGDIGTEMPGGFGPTTISFPRRKGFQFDPLAKAEFAPIIVKDAHGRTVYEGRVTGAPKATDETVTVECEGWWKHAEDNNGVQIIFMDRDLNAWGEMPAARAMSLYNIGFAGIFWSPMGGSTEVLTGPNTPPSLQMQTTRLAVTATRRFRLESWYFGNGASIGEVRFDGVNVKDIGVGDTNWNMQCFLAVDDSNSIFGTSSPDLDGTTTANSFVIGGPGYTYAYFYIEYISTTTSDGIWTWHWRNVRVIGPHGLTRVGATADTDGFLVDDMAQYTLGKYCPLFNIDPDKFETTSFPVPQMAFKEKTNSANIVAALSAFGGKGNLPLDYGVYEDRKPFMATPGTYGTTWRVRLDEGGDEEDAGMDTQTKVNGVVVTYNPGDGSSRSVGPPDSNAILETTLLQDLDPANPLNRGGIPKWAFLDAGIMSQAGAILLGQLVLYELNQQNWRGDVVAAGWVRNGSQQWEPCYMMRAGDYVIVEDSDDTRPRRINTTSYNPASGKNKVSIGAPPDHLAVLLSRAGAKLIAPGVGSTSG